MYYTLFQPFERSIVGHHNLSIPLLEHLLKMQHTVEASTQ